MTTPIGFKSILTLSNRILPSDTAPGFQSPHAPREWSPWDQERAPQRPSRALLTTGLCTHPSPHHPLFPASHTFVWSILGTWALFSFCFSVGTSSAVGTRVHRGWSGGERRKGKGRERGRGRRVEKGREEVSNHHPARATTPGAGCGATPIWAHGPGWGPARIQVPAKSARLPWDSGGSCSGQGETLEAEKAGRAGARPAPWPHSQDRGLCSEITLVAGPAPREAPGLAGCGRGAGPGQYLLNLLQVS